MMQFESYENAKTGNKLAPNWKLMLKKFICPLSMLIKLALQAL